MLKLIGLSFAILAGVLDGIRDGHIWKDWTLGSESWHLVKFLSQLCLGLMFMMTAFAVSPWYMMILLLMGYALVFMVAFEITYNKGVPEETHIYILGLRWIVRGHLAILLFVVALIVGGFLITVS